MRRGELLRYGFAAAFVAVAAPAEAQNIFNELARAIFGGGQRLRATPIYEYDEPVRPRAVRPRDPEASSKPKAPAVKLDPQADPHWYLKDPTLRRGDIVVTHVGVMVYQGRDSDAMSSADFVALGGADAKGWKQRLNEAAAGGRNVFGTGNGRSDTAEAAPPAQKRTEAARR